MRKQNLALCSSLSPLTIPQAADVLQVGRRTVYNLAVSGGLPLARPHWGERERRLLPLEMLFALKEFLGPPDGGRPWGLRRHWDRDVPAFLKWYEEMKAQGWRAQLVGGEWRFQLTEGLSQGAEAVISVADPPG